MPPGTSAYNQDFLPASLIPLPTQLPSPSTGPLMIPARCDSPFLNGVSVSNRASTQQTMFNPIPIPNDFVMPSALDLEIPPILSSMPATSGMHLDQNMPYSKPMPYSQQ
eukprot:812449_1